MATDSLLAIVMPPIEWIREKVFMGASELITNLFGGDVMVVYTIAILLVSFWLAGKILGNSYTTLSGRWGYLIVITAIIFYILRYLGAGI